MLNRHNASNKKFSIKSIDMAEYTKKILEWPMLPNGTHFTWLVNYAAYNAFGTFELSDKEWEDRNLISNFKGNSELTTEMDHQHALQEVIKMVTLQINEVFGTETKDLTLVCIPASKKFHTERRFKSFSIAVCKSTGMENAYDHFSYEVIDDEDKPDTLQVDEPYFEEKKVLVFDDLISTGGSICRFIDKLKALGADVVAAMALGKTLR